MKSILSRKSGSGSEFGRLNHASTLLIAIGNSGRRDDGLGWAFLDTVEKKGDFKGKMSYRYQLQVEDAALITEYEQIIFVDASKNELPQGFDFAPLKADADWSFSTHQIPPGTILHLAEDLYASEPEAFLLEIRGEEWKLEKGLSEAAKKNLDKALDFFEKKVEG